MVPRKFESKLPRINETPSGPSTLEVSFEKHVGGREVDRGQPRNRSEEPWGWDRGIDGRQKSK